MQTAMTITVYIQINTTRKTYNKRKKLKMKSILTLLVILMVLATASCTAPQTPPTPAPVSTDLPQANMPNPASVYCEGQGNKLEIRTATDGSQYITHPDFCNAPRDSILPAVRTFAGVSRA
jgi:putative hemolysin